MNAKQELIEHLVENDLTLKCAELKIGIGYIKDVIEINLPVNYNDEQYLDFLAKLDVENYDSGYGSQELFGTLWHTDSSWSEKGEYDGSEWWEHKAYPEIPEHLLR